MDYIAEPLRSLAVPIAELHEDPSNARKGHAVERIAASLKQYGQRKPIVVNRAQGGKVEAGNGTLAAAKSLGWTHIAAVYVDDDAATAAAYGIADNRVGEFSEWDADILGDLIPTLDGLFTGFLPAELDELSALAEHDSVKDVARGTALRNKSQSRVDIIWTQTSVGCCMAVHMGWLYGIQSGGGVCPCAGADNLHKVVFIDNEFKDYDHKSHVACVQKYRPKYATVRDVMTPEQCAGAGIDYYPLEQIIDFADELAAYADNVIVIPKYDCFNEIPERFMLGYSVPTTYGGTPLPFEAFSGRRIHLLGGNPEVQIEYYLKLPQDVVSLDNNQIHLKASFGNAWLMNGYTRLQSLTGCEDIATSKGLWPSVALSQASFASWFCKDSDDETQ